MEVALSCVLFLETSSHSPQILDSMPTYEGVKGEKQLIRILYISMKVKKKKTFSFKRDIKEGTICQTVSVAKNIIK